MRFSPPIGYSPFGMHTVLDNITFVQKSNKLGASVLVTSNWSVSMYIATCRPPSWDENQLYPMLLSRHDLYQGLVNITDNYSAWNLSERVITKVNKTLKCHKSEYNFKMWENVPHKSNVKVASSFCQMLVLVQIQTHECMKHIGYLFVVQRLIRGVCQDTRRACQDSNTDLKIFFCINVLILTCSILILIHWMTLPSLLHHSRTMNCLNIPCMHRPFSF